MIKTVVLLLKKKTKKDIKQLLKVSFIQLFDYFARTSAMCEMVVGALQLEEV